MQSASKTPVEGDAALALLDGVTELLVTRGKKVLRFDLTRDRPEDEELLGLMLGRSGKLRAPALRDGSRLLIGYAPDFLEDNLL